MDQRTAKRLMRRIGWYPPYLGAGIRVRAFDEDEPSFTVEMRLRWWNRNLFGTHFGGSLYSMCDPFYTFLVILELGRDYIVWDRGARIVFKRPGRGTVHAKFTVTDEDIATIREAVDADGRTVHTFRTVILGEDGEVVAEVEKDVYARRKKR